jgi:hypothetical protein
VKPYFVWAWVQKAPQVDIGHISAQCPYQTSFHEKAVVQKYRPDEASRDQFPAAKLRHREA